MKDLISEIRSGATPSIDECVAALGPTLALLQQFRDTPQDPDWHAEGDVHIHTGMVLDEAYELLRGPASHLSSSRRMLVVLGALLHDIAKPLATRRREVRGVMRTVAAGHEGLGRSYLAPRLLESGLSDAEQETLLGLVGYHHQPKLLVVKDRPRGSFARLARLADPELLYWVELADMRGRTSIDWQNGVDNIELFRIGAEAHELFERITAPTPGWRAHLLDAFDDAPALVRDRIVAESLTDFETGAIHSIEEAVARGYGMREHGADVVIIAGPSGSGKSGFIRKHLAGFDIVSLDDLRAEIGKGRSDQSANSRVLSAANEQLKESLRARRPVAWDATSLRRDFRQRVAERARAYGGLVTIVMLHLPVSEVCRRNVAREHPVAEAVLEGQYEKMQWPELDEAHRVLFLDESFNVRLAFGVTAELPYGLRFKT